MLASSRAPRELNERVGGADRRRQRSMERDAAEFDQRPLQALPHGPAKCLVRDTRKWSTLAELDSKFGQYRYHQRKKGEFCTSFFDFFRHPAPQFKESHLFLGGKVSVVPDKALFLTRFYGALEWEKKNWGGCQKASLWGFQNQKRTCRKT